ncbi:nucleotidyltransferase family protein [Ferruginibacter lapsinanis]|uniref:nucleotidyltransferase family protein n=1 Tax=Ferruginibacter lapsinanis TaxID=563172 RepID=UPI001E49683D|nr:nucleotidyltransferase family protein [Ferruginibacter lapsinanis]UEG49522.1 nucleotidyltransferase family protein [Ferruginibacter lapsinanis]
MIHPKVFYAHVPHLGGGGGGYEAIILAGGLGTRLRSVVADLPKCMAPVAGKPFLHYVITYLQKQGVEKFIFSVGYMYEAIEQYLSKKSPAIHYQLSIETEPLGTGGAIKLACGKATEKNVLVLNGDTLFSVNINKLMEQHLHHHAECTLSLKPMKDFDRYGVVELHHDLSIASFKEKQFYHKGLINGGVYALNVSKFTHEDLPEKFSFEKDYLERYFAEREMYGSIHDEYFIDIGIPEDFARAQTELK